MDVRLLAPKRNVADMNFEERRALLVGITGKCLKAISQRAKFKTNPVIYEPWAFDNSGESLFEYALKEKEKYFQRMGRYRHETQYPITGVGVIDSPFGAQEQKRERFRSDIEVPNFVDFYISVVNRFCEQGEDPGRASLIADMDVDCADLIHSRLQFGRYIIDGKIHSRPELKRLVENYRPEDAEAVLEHIIFKKQEEKVIAAAQRFCKDNNLGLGEEGVESLIKDFIRLNTNVQFEYLRQHYNVDLGELK